MRKLRSIREMVNIWAEVPAVKGQVEYSGWFEDSNGSGAGDISIEEYGVKNCPASPRDLARRIYDGIIEREEEKQPINGSPLEVDVEIFSDLSRANQPVGKIRSSLSAYSLRSLSIDETKEVVTHLQDLLRPHYPKK